MMTLAIDSATEACSVALFDGERLVAGEHRVLGRGHAERLVPMIAALPGKGRAGRIAVSLGPGSFTGIRVGIAAARALALAWGAELVGYPTLALVAAIARAQTGDSDIAVVMNGGHGEWFVQRFSAGGALDPCASFAPDEAASKTNEDLVAGSRADDLVVLRGAGRAIDLLPDARSFVLLDESLLRDDISPIYGRAPDARIPGTR